MLSSCYFPLFSICHLRFVICHLRPSASESRIGNREFNFEGQSMCKKWARISDLTLDFWIRTGGAMDCSHSHDRLQFL
jgi:hypothetical protein